jgi:hypothetical protein
MCNLITIKGKERVGTEALQSHLNLKVGALRRQAVNTDYKL